MRPFQSYKRWVCSQKFQEDERDEHSSMNNHSIPGFVARTTSLSTVKKARQSPCALKHKVSVTYRWCWRLSDLWLNPPQPSLYQSASCLDQWLVLTCTWLAVIATASLSTTNFFSSCLHCLNILHRRRLYGCEGKVRKRQRERRGSVWIN